MKKEDLEITKMNAEISKLIAETTKLNQEITIKLSSAAKQIDVETANKLAAETAKINRENFWYPLGIASALVASISTITALIIKIF